MSPRIKVLRKVSSPPRIKGFKPYGQDVDNSTGNQPVNLLYEEYEALKLSDYDMLNHLQASVMMGVSRPTFTRIYAMALRKISKAFVEGRQIFIQGGVVCFDSNWYSCRDCGCYFNNPEEGLVIEKCPLCGKTNIEKAESEKKDFVDFGKKDVCICPDCGFEQTHFKGKPCGEIICPRCNGFMTSEKNRKTR
jgi:predicted DNA-binding protein (UPF0251 family)